MVRPKIETAIRDHVAAEKSFESVFPIEGTRKAMTTMVDEGKVRFSGC